METIDRSEPRAGEPAVHCVECATPLSDGACPACSLGFLLHGSDPLHPDSPPRRLAESVEFGRYTLKRKLASGGMGVVYVADDRKLKRTVALKMIRGSTFADEADIARFTLEAEAAAGLDHPHIVPIYEVGHLEGQPFFTMKLIEGETLAARLKEHGGSLPAREVATLLSKIARAVHHAHQRGVLHRDLKPGNILLDAEGTPWLTDFGLAKLTHADSSLTLTRDHIGTPHYMAPEVAGGNARAVSMASDVWSLGVMLWEMLCGMPPFHGPGPVEIMRRIVTEEPSWPQNTRADGDLITIARRCMEKNPARRPNSAGEVADELDRWLRGEPIKARPVTRRERFVKWVRREPAMAALYCVLVLAFFSGLFLWRRAEHAVVSLTNTNVRVEESLRTATATKLAGDARLQVSEDPNRALLLAVESVKMTQPSRVLPEAASALMSVLTKAGGWDASQGAMLGIYVEAHISFREFHRRAVQISPDGRWLLSLNTLRWGEAPTPAAIYDLHDERESHPLRRWDIWDRTVNIESAIACWLPDSRRVLTVDGKGDVRIWSVITPEMDAGGEDTSMPAVQEFGTLPLREGTKPESIELWATGESTGAVWLEKTGSAFAKEHPDAPRRARLVRALVTPQGLRQTADFDLNLDQEAAPRASLVSSQTGQWVLVQIGSGKGSPQLVDLSGSTPVSHRLVLPANHLARPVFDSSGTHVALPMADSSVYYAALPKPGSPSQTIVPRKVLSSTVALRRVALSPDGRWLAAVGDTTQVFVVPLDEEKPVPVPHYFTGGDGITVRFSKDGQWLAAGGKDRAVYLWRMDTIRSGVPPVLLHGLPSTIAEIQISPDNTSVAAVAFGSVIRRWRFDGVSGAAMPRHFPAAGSTVAESTVSPDGLWAAAASDAWVTNMTSAESRIGSITLTRLTGGSRLVITGFGTGATGVAFSRDGRWLAATGRDAAVKVWDFAEAARCADVGLPAPPPRHVISVPGIRTEYRWVLDFHPDGRLFMANGDGVLFCWDLNSENPAATEQRETIHSISYLLPDVVVSPNGKYLAVGRQGWDQKQPGSDQYGSQILLFDVSQRGQWPLKRVAILQSDFLDYTQIAFSPDNRWLASGSTGYRPCLWDLTAPDILASLRRPSLNAYLISGVSFSPDSQRLAIGAADGQLYFWDWEKPAELCTLKTAFGINCTTWLPDGRLLASGASNQLSLWDTDLSRLQTLARRVAGRDLNPQERDRFRVPNE
ncbi:MAG TPA: serine/threonine-protein kinase [Verrucomicrobiales bacterium]|nr:serine/threonine-protein kinase [Verrucomicrobiales bacterium]